MIRWLLNIATVLSLLLSLSAAAMWVRSRGVAEGWESTPHPSGMIFAGSGNYQQWAVESAHGRLVYVSHMLLIEPANGRAAYVNHRLLIEPTTPVVLGGYYQTSDAITPLRHSRTLPPDYSQMIGIPHDEGRIPIVAVEWCNIPRWTLGTPPGLYVAVPWLTIAAAGLAIPFIRVTGRQLRKFQRRRPGFPVLPPKENPLGVGDTKPPLF